MIDMASIVRAVTRTTFILLSVLFIGWALFPEYRTIIAGLIVGAGVGFVNVRYLSAKTVQISQVAVSQEKKRVSFGFLTRMCLSLLVVMAAIKFEQISLWPAIIGLFTVQLIPLPVSIFLNLRRKD